MKSSNTPTAPPYEYGAIKHKTLIHALQYNAVATPDKVLLRWVNSKCEVVNSLTYQQLLSRAAAITTLLRSHGVTKGDRVMISYPFGLEVMAGIYGCMLLGAIPCSVYPPNPSKSAAVFSFGQFNNQVEDAGAKFALTTTKFRLVLLTVALTTSHRTNVTWLATDMLKISADEAILSEYLPGPRDSALIQYSSGSTGEPKGIVLSHSAIVHNIERGWADHRCKTQANNSSCTWMPQYHDFALIGFMIAPCYSDKDPCVLCSPVDFIQNPLLWADMIEKFEPTRTGGPNFAYALLAKRMEAAGRVLTNPALVCTCIAAEPIAPQTLEKMVAIGFPQESIVPAYGMAEVCVFLSSCYVGKTLQVLDGAVCCGDSSVGETSGTFIVTADEESGRILHDGSVGEIFARSPSLATGYWNKPELTQKMFGVTLDDGQVYYKTGDLGRIVSDRYLYVVGRSKELIIVNGKNIYPTDIEREVEDVYTTLVRPGSTVAFQYSDSEAGLVMELRRNVDPVDAAAKLLTPSILRRLVTDAHGVQLGMVTLLRQGTVPKTTSGKLRRLETSRTAISSEWKTSSIVWSWTKKALLEEVEAPSDKIDDTAVDGKYQDVLTSVLGEGFDLDKSWEENGLSSLMHVEISTLMSREFCVVLGCSFQLEHETPKALLNYIKASGQIPFATETAPMEVLPATLSPTAVALFQAVGVLLQMLALASAFVATYFIVSNILNDNIQSVLALKSGRQIRWEWFPITIPVAMIILTVITMAMKWIVIGRYRANVEVSVRSTLFLRWWFVDRMVHLWEFWVGQFIIDTPLIWIVYSLMGAKIHASARIDCLVREFDLLTIGRCSHVSHGLACRRFSLWQEDGPSIRFRPIVIGENCIVEGMVGLGTKLGDGCFVTDTSVLAEGAQVEAQSVVRGKPAFREGTHAVDEWRSCDEFLLKILKTFWLAIELYIFYADLLVAQVIWNGRLPYDWRYTPLCQWVLLLVTASSLNMLVSVALKWLLIGRRTTEQRLHPTLCIKLANWVCDYHFGASSALFTTMTAGSKIWNVILRLHGLDVDFQSGIVSNDRFPPSKVDQLRVRRSFVAAGVIFQPGGAIDILDSTVGYRVVVEQGVRIHRSTVAATMEVKQSLYDQNYQPIVPTRMFFVAGEVWSLLITLLVVVCLIPAFEFFNFAVKESPVFIAVPAFVLTLAIQCVSWTLLLRLVQATALSLKRVGGIGYYEPLYHIFIQMTFECRRWSQWSMLHGTPFFKTFLRFMGSNVKGDLFYNGSGLHDFHALVFEDKTIVDECQLMGHYQVGNTLTIGTSSAAGLLHPGCVTVANARLKSNIEHGPNTAFFQHKIEEDGTKKEMEV